MTDQPQSEHCDIENQCTHFCVYKGRYCPVYLRISRPRTPAPEPLASTKDMVQERQTKSPDARYQLCRSEPSKHVCINCDEAARTATLAAIEMLSDLNKYSCEEYEEASLSDNEKEMRIHLEYGNRLWGIIRSLRTAQEQQR